MVKHGYIPANLHLQNSNAARLPRGAQDRRTGNGPAISRLRATDSRSELVRIRRHQRPRRARRVACPGRGSAADDLAPQPPTVLPFSARSEEALVATAGQLADHLATHPDVTLSELGYTLGQRRTHLNHRHTVIADTIAEAREQLQALADGGQIATGRLAPTAPKLAFVCTGMGPQWWKMCRGLLGVLLRVHRKHPAQRPRTIPLHGLVVVRRAPA